ncbi:hypothetical protein STAS_03862 [Striga asiatica]|uniref:Uncharacterized protein n=1 Tax=Striga asiatica TaxID=4170 RepID=A0A5A7P6J2_STRAF|nr:hypothetical protein STAS_03862 [Striga asiatica]
MPNSSSPLTQQISRFRSRIQKRSFDDVTLRILESILASKDVQSLNRVESVLKQLMREESLLVLGEIAMETVEIKLLCLDFLIRVFVLIAMCNLRLETFKFLNFGEITTETVEVKLLCVDFWIPVFALIGDVKLCDLHFGFVNCVISVPLKISAVVLIWTVELCPHFVPPEILMSCLALRYEALVMRQEKASSHPELLVSSEEWLTFAEHSVDNGFHSLAIHACEKACCGTNHTPHAKINDTLHDGLAVEEIRRLNDIALLAISSQSVQAQAQAYLKQKEVKKSTLKSSPSFEAKSSGSSRFKSGIIKHNSWKLMLTDVHERRPNKGQS